MSAVTRGTSRTNNKIIPTSSSEAIKHPLKCKRVKTNTLLEI